MRTRIVVGAGAENCRGIEGCRGRGRRTRRIELVLTREDQERRHRRTVPDGSEPMCS
jgi:hypothetical protein